MRWKKTQKSLTLNRSLLRNKSIIEGLLEENTKMKQELEQAKKENEDLKTKIQEDSTQKKPGIKFSLENNNEDVKVTSGGK